MVAARPRIRRRGHLNATYDGMARVAGTSAIPVGRPTALRIESGSGRPLLNIPV